MFSSSPEPSSGIKNGMFAKLAVYRWNKLIRDPILCREPKAISVKCTWSRLSRTLIPNIRIVASHFSTVLCVPESIKYLSVL